MKKVLALVAVVGMIASIGCSGDNKGSTKTSSSSTTTSSSAKAS